MENNNIEILRHSLSHILATAIKEVYPGAKFAIGPAIENGFYYDIDFGEEKFREADLPRLENQMHIIINRGLAFERIELPVEEALDKVRREGQIYKEELLTDLAKEGSSVVVFYKLGDFEDLCRGPHLPSTKDIKPGSFKLDKTAGAYWKGDEKHKMLTRIYGLAFETSEELQKFLTLREEMQKRDHRKLGKELDLFCFSSLVGPGLPLFTPKGTIIKDELQKHIENVCRTYGFEKVSTPHLAKIDLYELSGHAKKFSDELFHVTSISGHAMVMKPVQCPHQTQIYASRQRSYRDLPIRYMESEKQYRAEKPGEVGGLNRVYAITVEDGHTFCTPEQVRAEVKGMVNIIKDFYSSLGLWENHWVSLSVRDYEHPEKYIGDQDDWDLCEEMLQQVSDEMGLEAKRCEGEAALYGPKLDFMFRDAIGKEIQIPTVQVDFATPKKFNLLYTDKDGSEKNPVMVHRAILGSYERFMALLIEHFAGAFPVWLSPVQVKILSVGESHIDFARNLGAEFKTKGIRIEVDDSSETLGNKIRKASAEKVPYILVIGNKEMESGRLAVRKRGEEGMKDMGKDELTAAILKDRPY